MPLRIAFAGSPSFAASILTQLIGSPYQPVVVFTQPDRPTGRGRRIATTPVKDIALQHAIPIEQPLSLKRGGADLLAEYSPDVFVVVAYGLILPQSVLDTPPLGCVNVHASLLPRWRGAAPIERAYMAGDLETGISIMKMEAGLDTGPVFRRVRLPIDETTSMASLYEDLAKVGGKALMETLSAMETNPGLAPEPQNDELATYAEKITARDRLLHYGRSALINARQINALAERSPVRQTGGNFTFQCLSASVAAGEAAAFSAQSAPGEITRFDDTGLYVECATDTLRISRVRIEGGKGSKLDAKQFHNGYRQAFPLGTILTNPAPS